MEYIHIYKNIVDEIEKEILGWKELLILKWHRISRCELLLTTVTKIGRKIFMLIDLIVIL